MKEYYAGRKYVYDVVHAKAEDGDLQRVSKSFDQGETVLLREDLSIKPFTESVVPRNPDSSLLQSALVYCLDNRVRGTLIPLRLVGSFFDFIPAHLGHNVALDNAVSCLCSIYQSTNSTSYSVSRNVGQKYILSLSSLRKCVSDDSLRMESETLCASILLQMCEVSLVLNVSTTLYIG